MERRYKAELEITASKSEGHAGNSARILFENGPGVSIPAMNEEGLQLLRRYHFSQRSVDHYMRRGAPLRSGQHAMIYAQASPALG